MKHTQDTITIGSLSTLL